MKINTKIIKAEKEVVQTVTVTEPQIILELSVTEAAQLLVMVGHMAGAGALHKLYRSLLAALKLNYVYTSAKEVYRYGTPYMNDVWGSNEFIRMVRQSTNRLLGKEQYDESED